MYGQHPGMRIMEGTTISFNQCLQCGSLDASCITICSKCLSSEMIEVHIPSHGHLVSWTTIRKPPLKFKANGVYNVAVVDLDNGFRVTGRYLHQEGDELGDPVIAIVQAPDADQTPTFKVIK